ncbi:purine-nucleoside phosphorylase [Buchnera aphidicola (Mindarus keteleerifoliae)]|uniref:purine-nucleoside phosphorylase n=1 Tax=Buchnera aphidicola TaxID=9 RepID=UPI0031B71962
MITPHIDSKENSFSEVVFVSGDPNRIRYIAKNYLTDVIKVNTVRAMLGFTGRYKSKIISLMAHGIGMPSCCLYVRELIEFYKVKKIIRLGSCGIVREDIKLNDLIISTGACTDSKMNRIKFLDHDFSAIPDFNTVYKLIKAAKKNNVFIRVGNFFSTDSFYFPRKKEYLSLLRKYNISGIDMETAGLYSVASELNVKSASICTVSDNIITGEKLTIKEREESFDKMIGVALKSVLLKGIL